MPHAVINGARLWYDVMGEGEPLLLHHGYTASRVNWMPVAERLRDHYQVILMDCRGTGESEDTDGGYTLPQYAADVIGLVDHLGLDRFTYAGHSMGGGIGFLLGLDHGARLNRLILMAAIPSGGIPGEPDRAYLERRMAIRASSDREALVAEMVAARFRPDVETDEWFASRADHILRVSDGHLIGGMETMYALDVADRLSELKAPTLVLAGAVDSLLQANLLDFLKLPSAMLHVFSRAGHEVAIHEPDGVARAIDEFMRHGVITGAMLAAAARRG